ncbi:MAG: di-heme oxidoredictase family protein [Ostreibacterium sp.]
MKICIFLLFFSSTPLFAHDDISRWLNTKNQQLNQPIAGLTNTDQDKFILGRSFFTIPWVVAPAATTARDGLGPLFNANTCSSCHHHSGLGEKYNKKGQLSRAIITKLSRKNGQPVPHYGPQIAINGLINVPFEALPTLTKTPIIMTYPDGETITLKKPHYGLKNLNYGKLPHDIIIVQRRSPALVGLGLLSRVSDETILQGTDPKDKNADGISGRANWISDGHNPKRLGRFTAKAAMPTVLEQIASAAANDMGLTNPLYPKELCEPKQKQCQNAPTGQPNPNAETLDLTMARLVAITTFITRTRIPVKKLNATGQQGKQLFTHIGCALCHLPKMQTANGITFAPYTDLLLHDMGDGLADGRIEFLATGREYRTAPLWGLSSYAKTLKSKKPYYLHDGRADSIEEAILWHAGEAETSKNAFMHLSKSDRQTVLYFLNHL